MVKHVKKKGNFERRLERDRAVANIKGNLIVDPESRRYPNNKKWSILPEEAVQGSSRLMGPQKEVWGD